MHLNNQKQNMNINKNKMIHKNYAIRYLLIVIILKICIQKAYSNKNMISQLRLFML